MTDPRPFTIATDDGTLDELGTRLRGTRFPAAPGNDDWRYGVRTDRLRALVQVWRRGFNRSTQRPLPA